ncbi:MAG: hypothetical protein M3Z54_03860 [Gemmatimonadota bacterium]|nr:hypothetical protein [Gemmatimonadota bacterium]
MLWNAKLIAGILVVAAALYYWLIQLRTGMPNVPLLYIFTFRLFPFADVLWTIAGIALLYRGYEEARTT